jgi:DNA-directed RNA polymerase I, II, and III subunit RPABC1
MDRWWRINLTLIEKLLETGYNVPSEAQAQVASLEAFSEAFPDAVSAPASMERVFRPRRGTMAELRAPNGVFLCFAVSEGKQILMQHVNHLEREMINRRVITAFFIVNGPLYYQAVDFLRSIEKVQRVVIFRQEQLTFNVTKHRRVPKHELLTPAEAAEWLAQTQLKRSQLPRIFEDDPMAKYYDAQPTELMRVVNPSVTVGSFTRVLVVARRLQRLR